ncbi:MAG: hypothetical protein Q7R76_04750 [Candidatus Woesearchaeota archaeon]|nr:hypothetical protein [Candidatus Woesearchaeota archaeon]
MGEPSTSDSHHPNLKKFVILFAVFSLLTIFFTYPLVFNLDKPMSHDPKDSLVFMWNMWWMEKSLHDGLPFFYTDYLFYPHGVDLTFHTLSILNSFIGMLLAKVVGYIAAYNILVLLTFPLAGYCMYLLGDYLLNNKQAAIIMGILYAFSPWHMFRILNHLNFASIQFIPLYILFLFKTRDNPTVKNSAIAALVLGVIFYLEPVYALFMILFTGLFLAYFFADYLVEKRKNQTTSAKNPTSHQPSLKKVWWKLVLIGALFIVLSSPHSFRMIEKKGIHTAVGTENDKTDVANYLLRPATSTVFKGGGGYEYLGISVLILAAAGMLFSKDNKKWFWILFAIIFFVLSIGEKGIRFYGNEFLQDIAMPANLLRQLPFMDSLRFTRFTFMVSLGTIVLAGYGIKMVLEKSKGLRFLKGNGNILVAVLLVGIIFIDLTAIPIPMSHATPQADEELSYYEDALFEIKGGAVLDLPLAVGLQNTNGVSARNMYAQMHHEHKIIGGLVSRVDNTTLHETDDILDWDFEKFRKTVRFVVLHRTDFTNMCGNLLVQKTGVDTKKVYCEANKTADTERKIKQLIKKYTIRGYMLTIGKQFSILTDLIWCQKTIQNHLPRTFHCSHNLHLSN